MTPAEIANLQRLLLPRFDTGNLRGMTHAEAKSLRSEVVGDLQPFIDSLRVAARRQGIEDALAVVDDVREWYDESIFPPRPTAQALAEGRADWIDSAACRRTCDNIRRALLEPSQEDK